MTSDFMARWAPEGPDRQKGVTVAGKPAWPGTAGGDVAEPAVDKDKAAAPPISAVPVNKAQPSTEAAENGSGVDGYDLVAARKAAAADNDTVGDHPDASAPIEVEFDAAKAAQRWTPSASTNVVSASAPREHIRIDEVVKTRRLPPEMGWRKTVYVITGHLVNLGAGSAEQRFRDWVADIKGNIPGNYQVGVIGIKGGVGKTRITAGVGTAVRMFRKEPVIAIDANPTYGGLGRLTDPRAALGIKEFLADNRMTGYTRARQYTGQNPQGLEVLAGNQNVANPVALSPEGFAATLARTRKFYDLALIDCGDGIEHPVMAGVLSAVDALIIVGSTDIEGGLSAEQTIKWLAARNGHELLRRSVLVLNDVHHCMSKKFVTHITQKLGPQVGAVKTIPWDVHLRDAATLDWEALRRATRWAFIELGAELASGFPTAGALAAG
jgi:MinD-like ATPase involved in chromosome partitioning or flagellar assembly